MELGMPLFVQYLRKLWICHYHESNIGHIYLIYIPSASNPPIGMLRANLSSIGNATIHLDVSNLYQIYDSWVIETNNGIPDAI